MKASRTVLSSAVSRCTSLISQSVAATQLAPILVFVSYYCIVRTVLEASRESQGLGRPPADGCISGIDSHMRHSQAQSNVDVGQMHAIYALSLSVTSRADVMLYCTSESK